MYCNNWLFSYLLYVIPITAITNFSEETGQKAQFLPFDSMANSKSKDDGKYWS